MLTDLFGDPVTAVPPVISAEPRPYHRKRLEEKREEYQRLISSSRRVNNFIRKMEQQAQGVLFNDILDYLKSPIIKLGPKHKHSDRADVALLPETGEEADGQYEAPFPEHVSWGPTWITDRNGFTWSAEALQFLQIQQFWESLEELGLHNNEHEKWSVLKWVFMPAIRKYYVFDKRINKSHCLTMHERDHPFSYHNCAMAAKINGDDLRDMLRERLPPEIIEAVEQVVTF